MDWYKEICYGVRGEASGWVWSDGSELLCHTESVADALADLIEQLYFAQGVEMICHTGYYDPAEDERSGEVDDHTGWWYVEVE